MDYRFCDVNDVLSLTRIGDGYTKLNDLVSDLVPLATNQIQQFCRRDFIKQEYTEFLPLRQSEYRPQRIYLNERGVAATPVPQVKLDYGYPLNWSQVPALAVDQYRIDYAKGILTLLFATSESSEALRVVYTAGYAVDINDPELVLVPVELKRATAIQTAHLLSIIVNQNVGQTTKGAGASSKQALDKAAVHGIVPQARALIAGHRKQLIGY